MSRYNVKRRPVEIVNQEVSFPQSAKQQCSIINTTANTIEVILLLEVWCEPLKETPIPHTRHTAIETKLDIANAFSICSPASDIL